MKKLLTLLLVVVMAFGCMSLVACNNPSESNDNNEAVALEDLKIGFIFLHDASSTYDANFMRARDEVVAKLGLRDDQVKSYDGIPEGNECYEIAADFADQGFDIVFADSFGHEDFMIQAAREFPEVEFCHATGTKAHTEGLDNYHNAFASIYEGRFLAGVAAGLKLKEMGETKMGYVGAYPYAEVKSGYTSFYLGAKYIVPEVTMEVTFTNEWYHVDKEKNGAELLIERGAKLVSQHADSMGAPSACENAGVPNVSYNGSTQTNCPNTYIVSSYINWAPYFEYIINCVTTGTEIATDWCGNLSNGSVKLTAVNESVAAAGTAAKIEEVKAKLISGELHVFDTNTFTVGGSKLASYLADVDTDANWTPDTEVIENGVFYESKHRSAPYFDINIDGITILEDVQ